MSTVKISELTALTSADAADELVIVDDSAGVTKKITHANLANFGSNTLTAGLVNATGINFGADTLDDYEEGTWTPTGNGITFSAVASATYTKIGGLVHVQTYLTFPSTVSGSDAKNFGFALHTRSKRAMECRIYLGRRKR